MKSRPILFSAPMVQALLAGAKTQTRRVAKLNAAGRVQIAGRNWHCDDPESRLACPYGQPGDVLWCRETCRADELPSGLDGVRYLADAAFIPIENTEDAADRWGVMLCYRNNRGATVPPIHMPRWASRILLEIVAVRIERLQDISEEDARAEGVTLPERACTMYDGIWRDAYQRLWENINGAGSWELNPWVWCIEFRRI